MPLDVAMTNAALFYSPDAYSTSGPKLMGRNAAGESFLRAYLQQSTTSEYWCAVAAPEHARLYAQQVQALKPDAVIKAVLPTGMQELSAAGVLYSPGPGLGDFAWGRGAHGHHAYSLCGITHTTASKVAMDAIADLVMAPLREWDALICTSRAVRANVGAVVGAQLEHCRQRFGATQVELPQLPVIPLGVHGEDFSRLPHERHDARKTWGIGDDDVVILFVGRLSFHAKAHPLAMYQALQAVSKETSGRVVLLECGWFSNEHIKKAFDAAAAAFAPSVRVLRADGRSSAERRLAWHAADIFCSLADNIQETFGITPVEAMASGLPVIVSDWDGYRDTVRHGIDGFRIPTLAPPAGSGIDLANRHAWGVDTYDMYCGFASSLVAVDIDQTTQALKHLVGSAELRAEMGRAGQAHVRERFDWSVVMQEYGQLWDELNSRRAASQALRSHLLSPSPSTPTAFPWPARLDPFHAFAAYPTHALAADTTLTMGARQLDDVIEHVRQVRELVMINFVDSILPTAQECEAVIRRAADGPMRAVDLLADLPQERRATVFRSLVWLVKIGALKCLALNSRKLHD
jgi:glycosyltransferase involved in cell wall biosynthesis